MSGLDSISRALRAALSEDESSLTEALRGVPTDDRLRLLRAISCSLTNQPSSGSSSSVAVPKPKSAPPVLKAKARVKSRPQSPSVLQILAASASAAPVSDPPTWDGTEGEIILVDHQSSTEGDEDDEPLGLEGAGSSSAAPEAPAPSHVFPVSSICTLPCTRGCGGFCPRTNKPYRRRGHKKHECRSCRDLTKRGL